MAQQNEPHVAVIAAKLDALAAGVEDVRAMQRDMANAIMKLAVVEDRQTQYAASVERLMIMVDKYDQKLDKFQDRVSALELAAPMQRQTSNWVLSGVWCAAGLLVMFAGKKLGLL